MTNLELYEVMEGADLKLIFKSVILSEFNRQIGITHKLILKVLALSGKYFGVKIPDILSMIKCKESQPLHFQIPI